MEIHVTENAINSLQVELDFYNKFLDNLDNIDISVSHFGNLKFSVVAIHNAVELLSKSILLDVNELIVFNLDIESDSVVCTMLRNQFYKKHKKTHIAYNAVFSNNNYKTIDYSKCIKLIRKIFNDKVNHKNYDTLSLLGQYRNTLTHLGYASIYEWYKILVVLNDALELIMEFYIKNITNSDRYFSNEITNLIRDTLIKSDKVLPELWMANNEAILNEINIMLDHYFENSIIIEEVKQGDEYKFYETIAFRYREYNNLKWTFKYSYLNEAIIIIDQNSKIVCYISIEDENLKYKKDDNNFPTELEAFDIYIPKKSLEYDKSMRYDIKSKNSTKKQNVERIIM